MEVIAKVKIDNKIYAILLNNKQIVFAKIEGCKINRNLEKEEFSYLYKICELLEVKEERSLKICQQYVNGKMYDIYLDTKTKNYFWKNTKNSSLNIPEDNEILNYRYNHDPIIINSEIDEETKRDEARKQKSVYTKLFRIGKKTAIVFLAGTIALSAMKRNFYCRV